MTNSARGKLSRSSLATVVAVTAVPVVLLFALQWYLLDRFAEVTGLVLKQASQEVATRFAAQIRSDFEATMPNLVEAVPHDAVRHLEWKRVTEVLDSKAADYWFVDRFLMWSRPESDASPAARAPQTIVFRALGSKTAGESAALDQRYPEGFFTDALSSAVFAEAASAAGRRVNFGFAPVTAGGRDYYVVLHFVYDVPDRAQLGAVLGFTIDVEHLRRTYFRRVLSVQALGEKRLPGFPRPTALVLDERGTEVYSSDPFAADDVDNGAATIPMLFFNVDLLDARSPLRAQVPRWSIRTGYAGTTIPAIIRRQTAQQRALWFVLMLITGAGFVLAARASVQQLRLVQLKSAFVSSVSHELKTPLAKIQLFTDTLRSGRVRSLEKAQEYYDVISAQTSKLERLVDGILEIARIDGGVTEHRRDPVDLRTVAQNALESHEHELSRNGFEVEVALATREVLVLGDAEQLETVVSNLLGNAIKYSDGTKFVSLAVRSDHKYGVVEVADRGVGIPPAHVPRIFDKFYRVSPAGDATPAGFGLGLAIVDRVVHAHGGRVVVHSEPGRGSTFRVELPIHVNDSGEPT